jgi:divalent metal cation (Fe/Co/Zn/Cd) transporter
MRNRSVLIGLLLFAAGVAVALLVLSRLVYEGAPVIPVLWFLAMLSGVGFAVLLGWLWVQSRRRKRTVRSSLTSPRSSNPT